MTETHSGRTRGAGRPVDHSKDEAIITAAHELLFEKGPAGVSIEAVSRQAGVSKVTIYSRFSNKDALVDAVISHLAHTLMAELAMAPGHPDNLRESLTAFGTRLITLVLGEEHLGFLRALAATHTPAELLDRIYRTGPAATNARLETWMAEAHTKGLARIPDPARSTELLLGMLLGLDLVRTTYGQAPLHAGPQLREHVTFVVEAFLTLHPPRHQAG